MAAKIRNYSVGVLIIGLCIMGLLGPVLYPELMIEAQLNSGYYIPML